MQAEGCIGAAALPQSESSYAHLSHWLHISHIQSYLCVVVASVMKKNMLDTPLATATTQLDLTPPQPTHHHATLMITAPMADTLNQIDPTQTTLILLLTEDPLPLPAHTRPNPCPTPNHTDRFTPPEAMETRRDTTIEVPLLQPTKAQLLLTLVVALSLLQLWHHNLESTRLMHLDIIPTLGTNMPDKTCVVVFLYFCIQQPSYPIPPQKSFHSFPSFFCCCCEISKRKINCNAP